MERYKHTYRFEEFLWYIFLPQNKYMRRQIKLFYRIFLNTRIFAAILVKEPQA